ncbi:hypothetical protein LMG24076_03680 [Trinickia soli]|nr:hypothetical protein LMG24076_03680 [Trinickia soli]
MIMNASRAKNTSPMTGIALPTNAPRLRVKATRTPPSLTFVIIGKGTRKWWAVSFPLAASAICALRYAGANPGPFTNSVGVLLLGIASIAIVGLFVRTLKGVLAGELRALSS